MASPVLVPGGQFVGRAPQRSVIEWPPPLATHSLSLPSTAMPQGESMLLPPSKVPTTVPSGRTKETSPPGYLTTVSYRLIQAFADLSASDSELAKRSSNHNLILFRTNANFSIMPGWPRVLATHALPRLSMAMARGPYPTLICSALPGSLAGNRVTVSAPPLVIQIRSCWSTARWKGPLTWSVPSTGTAIHGAAQNASLCGVSLGQIDDLVLLIVERPHIAIRRG